MRPHLSERLADLRADLVQNPASEAEFNLLELVYLDALRAHIQGLTNARLSHLQSAQAEAMAAAEAVWQSQTALLAEQRRAAEAARAAAALALSAATFPAETEPEAPAFIPAPVSFAPFEPAPPVAAPTAPSAEEFAFEPDSFRCNRIRCGRQALGLRQGCGPSSQKRLGRIPRRRTRRSPCSACDSGSVFCNTSACFNPRACGYTRTGTCTNTRAHASSSSNPRGP